MAFVSKQQQLELLKQIPSGQDPVKVFQGLVQKGNTLEGYGAPTTQTPLQTQDIPQDAPPSNDNFLVSAFKGITSPITKGLASGVRSIQAIPGLVKDIASIHHDEQGKLVYSDTHGTGETLAKPLFGSKTLAGSTNAENLGTAANAASWLVSPFAAGVLGGGGQALEEGKGLKEAAITGLTGGVLNKILPGVAGKLYGALPQGVKTAASTTVERAGKLLSPIAKGLSYFTAPVGNKLESKVEQSVIKANSEILNLSAKTLNKEANTGKDVASFLAKENISLAEHVQGGQLFSDVPKQQILAKAKVEDGLLSTYLSTEKKLTSIEDITKAAVSELKSNGIDKDRAAAYVQQQIEALARQTPNAVVEHNGTTYLTLEGLNDIKGKSWGNVVNFADPNASVINDANTAIGRSIKKHIENSVEDVDIKAYNQRLGDLYHAAEALTERNGKKVANRRLGPMFNRGIGAIAGGLGGGPAGSVAGAVMGDKITSYLTDNAIGAQLKQTFLNKLRSTPEGSALVSQLENKLKTRLEDLIDLQMNPARQLEAGAIIGQAPAGPKGGSFYDPSPDIAYQNNIPKLPSGTTNGVPNVIPLGTTDKSFTKIHTGSVPPPAVAKGAGMYVVPRKNLRVSDSVIPKVKPFRSK